MPPIGEVSMEANFNSLERHDSIVTDALLQMTSFTNPESKLSIINSKEDKQAKPHSLIIRGWSVLILNFFSDS